MTVARSPSCSAPARISDADADPSLIRIASGTSGAIDEPDT